MSNYYSLQIEFSRKVAGDLSRNSELGTTLEIGWLKRAIDHGSRNGELGTTLEIGWLNRAIDHGSRNTVLTNQPIIFTMYVFIFKVLQAAGNKNKLPVEK